MRFDVLRSIVVVLGAATVAAFLIAPRSARSEAYDVSISPGGFSDGGKPIVTAIVNGRVPFATQRLKLVIRPAPPPGTVVTWTSPDGRNEIGETFHAAGTSSTSYAATVADEVGVFETSDRAGAAEIVADIGAPVNARATIAVVDGIGIGFGCYGFTPLGPSLRFVGGEPQRSTLADADVAVVGPGRFEGTVPGYGCWGENFDAHATSYRLVFKSGGRLIGTTTFLRELPYDDVDRAGGIDVIGGDGGTYRLHISGGAGTYFGGWVEPLTR